MALNSLHTSDPYNFRTPIYTQWAMIGGMLIIFLLIPESPWWLAGRERLDKAGKILQRLNGHIEGYEVQEVLVSV